MLESLLRELGAGVAFVDRDLRYVLVNERLARLNGVAAAAHSGRTVREVIPAYADQAERALAQVFASGRAVGEIPVDVPGAGGEPALRLLITCFPVCDAAGEVRWAGVIATDVTERERATRELRESEERFRLAARAARDVVWDWNLTTDSVAAADGVMRVFGFPEAQVGSGTSWWAEQLHPEDRDRVLASIAAAVEQGEFWSEEYRHRRADGEYATVVDRAYVVRDDAGRAIRMVGVTTDVTQERRVLEQAEAAQRMETVGRLAGGVAHEVNNALQGVLSFTDFVLRSLQNGVVHRGDVEQIRHAAERAARITRQLLAFSRRQLLTPERLDLNAVVTE
ncbi:MAG: PAS domain-containing protein, partial [Gemmatimonadota bacterium]|nr:PAS domain-containing protein [Gemmatimonadota bacterium]